MIDATARFAAAEPGWIERVRAQHTRRGDGSCAGCGSYRMVRWPCVLIDIAGRAEQLLGTGVSRRSVQVEPPAGGRCPEDPAASRPSPPSADTAGERPAAGHSDPRGVA